MCLVDIRAMSAKQATPLPKLQIACNTVVQDGMVVETDNEKVRAARKAVLEFLLINHPIDCPICDQAGECKLQEYYMDYGRYQSRFELEDKVEKHKVLPVGPSVMLDQERCILCTRCVRFLEEVTDTHELTITQRGNHSELTLAEGKWVDNPYAENIVDICPVGALTNRDFRFKARVWYLECTPSICTGCSTGCSTEVYSRRGEIYRIRPRHNPEVNGYWMCDYGRTTFLDNRRGDRAPASLTREDGRFLDASAQHVAARAAASLRQARRVGIVASASLTMEEGFLLSEIAELLGNAKRIVVSPSTSDVPDDGKLVSTDRYPNRRGLVALGFEEATSFGEPCDGVVVVRCDPAADGDEWKSLLEEALAVVVVGDRVGESADYADHLLAIASHFEAEGAFVNRQGRLQSYAPAVPPPGNAVPGWQALAAVVSALGGRAYRTRQDLLDGMLARLKAGKDPIIAASRS